MTDDYRKYLESEFGHIRTELLTIKEQTAQTSDRIGHTEEEVIKLKIANVEHIMNCPAMIKINETNDDLQEYRMAKRYFKTFIFVLAVLILGSIAGFLNTFEGLRKLSHRVDMINTPVRTRSGAIELWPSGVIADTLKKNVPVQQKIER